MNKALLRPKKFIGLHAHDGFSIFDGMGLPGEHFKFVLENTKDEPEGPRALAITNHGNMSSYISAYTSAIELNKAGQRFKFLPGVELYVHPDLKQWRADKTRAEAGEIESDDAAEHGSTIENEEETKSKKAYDPVNRKHHLVVLAKNSQALERLFSIVSRGFTEGFYKKPRVDYSMLKQFKGDFVVSSACVGGPFSYSIFTEFPNVSFDDLKPELLDDPSVMSRIVKKLENELDVLIDAVGQENMNLELQFNKLNAQHLTNRALIELSKKTGVPLVVTADSHYCRPDIWRDRALYQQLGWLNYTDYDPSRLPKSIDELKAELYPKNAEQIWDTYKKTGSQYSWYDDEIVCRAIERTHDIAFEQIGDPEPDKTVKLPAWSVPVGETAAGALRRMTYAGLEKRGLSDKDEYRKRIEMELDVIEKKSFCEYFLTMKTIMDIAAENMLVGAGRGSAAGSLVNYCLEITHIDPLKFDLLFERFINLSRCLDPSIFVKTNSGAVKIGDIVPGQVIAGRVNDVTVLAKTQSKHQKLCKLTIKGQEFICSLNHRWIVRRNGQEIEVMASDIQSTDEVLLK